MKQPFTPERVRELMAEKAKDYADYKKVRVQVYRDYLINKSETNRSTIDGATWAAALPAARERRNGTGERINLAKRKHYDNTGRI